MTRTFALAVVLGLACGMASAEDAVIGKVYSPAARAFFDGDFPRAQSAYEAIAPASPDFEDAQRQLGAIALYESRLDDAERLLLAAVAKDPNDGKAASLLAEIASRRGDFVEASQWLRKAGKGQRAQGYDQFGHAAPYRATSAQGDARVPFVQTDPLPAVMARVNGVEGLFLIDTGAAEIVLDPVFAGKLGLVGSGGVAGTFAGGKTSDVFYTRIAKLSLDTLDVADVPAMLVSTAGFSAAANGRPVAGVIGTEFLMRFRSTIDYPGGALSLAPRDSSSTAMAPQTEIPFVLVGSHFILARGTLNGGAEQSFFVDSGLAGFAFTAPASTLQAAGIPLPALAASGSGAVGQSAAAPFKIKSLTLGMLQRENLDGLYGPFPPSLESSTGVHIAGIVSHAFFRSYAVTFDFVRMRISLTKPPA